MKTLKTLICVILITSSVGCWGMIMTPTEDKLMQVGRYSEVEAHLEGKVKDLPSASTREVFHLCLAYSHLKEYNKLFPCLDQLQSHIDRGDRSALGTDISAVPSLLRAEAYIDFGNYAAAEEQAAKSYDIVQKQKDSFLKRLDDVSGFHQLGFKIQALSALALSQALRGNRAKAEESARLLEEVDTNTIDSKTTGNPLVSLTD